MGASTNPKESRAMNANLVAIFLSRQGGHEAKPALLWNGEVVCTFGELPAAIGQPSRRARQPRREAGRPGHAKG